MEFQCVRFVMTSKDGNEPCNSRNATRTNKKIRTRTDAGQLQKEKISRVVSKEKVR